MALIISTKTGALDALKCLLEDFEKLQSGEWEPDDDSCNASIEVVHALIRYAEKG